MSRKKIAVLLVLLIAATFGVKEAVRKYPDVRADILERVRQKEIYAMSGVERTQGFHDKMDTLMAFVHNNSEHRIDDEYYHDLKNKPQGLDKLLAYARGEREERPPMACAARSRLLLPLATIAGFEGRMIDLFKYEPDYPSHVVVEVKNPDTGDWEVYDPTYQIYWKDDKTGKRASMQDLVMGQNFHFTPCHDENRCGFRRADHGWPPSPDVADFFGYAVIMNDEREGVHVYNNTDRFDSSKSPEGEGELFCDWGGKRWCPAGAL